MLFCKKKINTEDTETTIIGIKNKPFFNHFLISFGSIYLNLIKITKILFNKVIYIKNLLYKKPLHITIIYIKRF